MADLAPIETDWITDADPARPGVYQRKYPDTCPHPVLFHKWDGSRWMAGEETAEEAEAATTQTIHHGLPWRGVVPEVHSCVPVAYEDGADGCSGCAFYSFGTLCSDAFRAADCGANVIIWRPRSEVAA